MLAALTAIGAMVLMSACAGTPGAATVENKPTAPVGGTLPVGDAASDVIVYASDLSSETLNELDFIDDPASPGGKLIGLPNTGDELDPPPENDPHAIFQVPVQSGIPYRCWIHMKVGAPKGRSTANVIWVQFSNSISQANEEILRPGTESYLTAQGPGQEGWTWVGCDASSGATESLVYFQNNGEVTVRIQAGAEGVGFDQFILSPARFLNSPPSDAVIGK